MNDKKIMVYKYDEELINESREIYSYFISNGNE
jgi:hypothetical protein